jgi:hypothetical protein
MMARVLALAALGGLCACETLGDLQRNWRREPSSETTTAAAVPQPAHARPSPRSNSDDLLAYVSRLRAMNESALGAEATRQKAAAARDNSDATRVRAALALSLAPQADDSDVLALVDPIVKRDNADPGVRVMASVLQAFAQERRRLRENAATARASVREEKRLAETQKQRADALQERAAQLQQKLDALTELEKSLSDRPAPSQ